jgi:hypothetical protein
MGTRPGFVLPRLSTNPALEPFERELHQAVLVAIDEDVALIDVFASNVLESGGLLQHEALTATGVRLRLPTLYGYRASLENSEGLNPAPISLVPCPKLNLSHHHLLNPNGQHLNFAYVINAVLL